ncbi:4-alpha-glucanotransferase [Parasegetibacter sp. NRK P23]|uniref:4-alpha-glucanotransferase n=1 Tax=Parasegetibacter sp. NRK P23 TaxID=2942999 RepID=UPI0020431716|nr:4-alpha-glucanotransferase [Parasegetibacter sp. NRK P23]
MMKICFYLRYHTRFGQLMLLDGNFMTHEKGKESELLEMTYLNNECWMARIEVDPVQQTSLHYKYYLRSDDGSLHPEGENDRVIDLSRITAQELHLTDTWNYSGEFQNVFYTAPFQETLFPRLPSAVLKEKAWRGNTHIFRVKAPLLEKDEVLCLCGSMPALGDWSTETPVILNKEGNWWTAKLNLAGQPFPVAYKYGVYHLKKKQFIRFEDGNNRILFDAPAKGKVQVLHDGFALLPNNTWRGTGVSVPVFSIRTGNGYGVGEFPDLKLLVDWAHRAGMKMIQILPVNDTTATHTWTDSYPYAAVSAFALHPIYLNPEKLAGKEQDKLVKKWRKTRKTLNDLPELDYEKVMQFKWSAFRELYDALKEEVFQDESYKSFFQQHRHWLEPYAAFCYLRDKYGTSDYTRWKTHSVYEEKSIRKLTARASKHFDEIGFQYFIQYHLHLQLEEAVTYAHGKGIVIKGDIPIGIYRHSADAWVDPSLYNMDQQAGAPPDDFAVKGQNWGFPTYNWKKMQEDGFSWWRKRFEQMSHYFDAFRIDHILGFFRIWSIPLHAVEGIMGRFVPAVPVHINEISARSISFDHTRFCKPFINDAIIWELFDGDAEHIKTHFVQHVGEGLYEMRPGFDTQRKVEAWFHQLEPGDYQHKFKTGLYDLLSNVIFFPDEKEPLAMFHFRFGMQQTISFRELDHYTKTQLEELYVDYFFRRQDFHWKEEAMHKLPDLKAATNMLICGEDLGLVPACVPDVMKELGILSLEIQRMPKGNTSFFHPSTAPYLSVITPATHDMSTIRGWWEEDRSRTQEFYNHVLGQWGEAPHFCEAWINKAILLQHLYSPAMWCVFQVQDILGIDERLRRENPHEERINVPANPKNYWRYRMHIPLEELLRQKTFTEEIQTYIRQSGRG